MPKNPTTLDRMIIRIEKMDSLDELSERFNLEKSQIVYILKKAINKSDILDPFIKVRVLRYEKEFMDYTNERIELAYREYTRKKGEGYNRRNYRKNRNL